MEISYYNIPGIAFVLWKQMRGKREWEWQLLTNIDNDTATIALINTDHFLIFVGLTSLTAGIELLLCCISGHDLQCSAWLVRVTWYE